MAYKYEYTMDDWAKNGEKAAPSDSLKNTGFTGGMKPPASVFNYFWSWVINAIKELQSKALTEIPSTVAPSEHKHSADDINETSEKKLSRIVSATRIADTVESLSGGGQRITVNYTADVNGITELYNGLEITVIPDKSSRFDVDESLPEDQQQNLNLITLNVNGLGAAPVRQPLSFSTFVATTPTANGFMHESVPCRLMYHETYTSGGIWLMAEKQKTSAQDLYGIVPVEDGGTGASTAEEARENLGAAPAYTYGTTDMEDGVSELETGKLYFYYEE